MGKMPIQSDFSLLQSMTASGGGTRGQSKSQTLLFFLFYTRATDLPGLAILKVTVIMAVKEVIFQATLHLHVIALTTCI